MCVWSKSLSESWETPTLTQDPPLTWSDHVIFRGARSLGWRSVLVQFQVKAGAVLNILCVLTMTLCIHTWAMAYFDLDTIPWSHSHDTNGTTVSSGSWQGLIKASRRLTLLSAFRVWNLIQISPEQFHCVQCGLYSCNGSCINLQALRMQLRTSGVKNKRNACLRVRFISSVMKNTPTKWMGTDRQWLEGEINQVTKDDTILRTAVYRKFAFCQRPMQVCNFQW